MLELQKVRRIGTNDFGWNSALNPVCRSDEMRVAEMAWDPGMIQCVLV